MPTVLCWCCEGSVKRNTCSFQNYICVFFLWGFLCRGSFLGNQLSRMPPAGCSSDDANVYVHDFSYPLIQPALMCTWLQLPTNSNPTRPSSLALYIDQPLIYFTHFDWSISWGQLTSFDLGHNKIYCESHHGGRKGMNLINRLWTGYEYHYHCCAGVSLCQLVFPGCLHWSVYLLCCET